MIGEYDLYYTSWEDIPYEFQAFFIEILGGSHARAKDFYQLYFNWFNVAHEMAHILKLKYGTSKYLSGDFWQEEQDANDFAVIYWRHQRQQRRLQLLSEMLKEALSVLPHPVPADASPQTFFNENYAELGKQPAKYGHFQLSFVKEALKLEMDLITVLRTRIHPGAQPADAHVHFEYEEINANLPPRVVEDLRQVIAPFGVSLPSINVIKEFYPLLMFVVPGDERDEWLKMAADMRSSWQDGSQ